MNKTSIEWTDWTSNPIRAINKATGKAGHFCEKVSPGCAHCYASTMNESARFIGTGLEFLPANRERVDIRLNEKELREWRKPRYGGQRIFAFDMTDLFGEWVPDEWLSEIFAAMSLALTYWAPGHEPQFQILTKRPERMRAFMLNSDLHRVLGYDYSAIMPLPNVWLGVTVENQHFADERIPVLLDTPAAVRFISAEPLLSGLDLSKWMHDRRREGISGADSSRLVYGQTGRNNLAEHPVSRRGSFPASVDRANQGGTQYVGERGRLPASDVQRRGQASEGERQSDFLDGGQPSGHSAADGREPQGWQQTAQSSGQPRTEHAGTERQPLISSSGPANQGAARRDERSSEVDRRTGGRDSRAGQGSLSAAETDSSPLRRNTEHGFSNRHGEELGLTPPRLDWVIVGGESGPRHRPFDPDWARSIVAQCRDAGVSCFVKQLGGARPGNKLEDLPEDLRVREYPEVKA